MSWTTEPKHYFMLYVAWTETCLDHMWISLVAPEGSQRHVTHGAY
jgi:hypothetical protein